MGHARTGSRVRGQVRPYLVDAGLAAGEREGEAQRQLRPFEAHVVQEVGDALHDVIEELQGEGGCRALAESLEASRPGSPEPDPKQWASGFTSSPVPCMISSGMAKILLYMRTDLRPLRIFTSSTRKLVPPRSRARNFPFSVMERLGVAFQPCTTGLG